VRIRVTEFKERRRGAAAALLLGVAAVAASLSGHGDPVQAAIVAVSGVVVASLLLFRGGLAAGCYGRFYVCSCCGDLNTHGNDFACVCTNPEIDKARTEKALEALNELRTLVVGRLDAFTGAYRAQPYWLRARLAKWAKGVAKNFPLAPKRPYDPLDVADLAVAAGLLRARAEEMEDAALHGRPWPLHEGAPDGD
jgi:hypothetical protein